MRRQAEMNIGILGGTGLYELPGMQAKDAVSVDTPFGPPSDPVRRGRFGGHDLFFLPRHGEGHRILPSEINHRANIFAMKALGVERIVSISAVGSLREDLHPRDVVLPDQYFDRTKASDRHTFFGNGIVGHIPFADPVCPDLRRLLRDASRAAAAAGGLTIGIHDSGTYVNMEGPAFSTRAESEFHRRMGFDVVGMTGLAEAKLCREAEICYACVAMVTDYDCWKVEEEPVTVEMVIAHLHANATLARAIVQQFVAHATETRPCGCGRALETALMTAPDRIPPARKAELKPIVGKYLR